MKSLKVLHIPGRHFTLSTEPNMKVDIDGEISLETPIEIEVLPKAIQLLTFPDPTTKSDTTALYAREVILN